jgi:tripartite-type tricarboxylate transporter receptor subunit TctC
MLAPAKTPPDIIARMNSAMAEALQAPVVEQSLTEQGSIIAYPRQPNSAVL